MIYSNCYYIMVNYTTALHWGHTFFRPMKHKYDTPLGEWPTHGRDQHPLIKICTCAILRCANTMAKPATETPCLHSWVQGHVIKIRSCASEGKQKEWQIASNFDMNPVAVLWIPSRFTWIFLQCWSDLMVFLGDSLLHGEIEPDTLTQPTTVALWCMHVEC